jgi:hypothetical protein
MRHRLGALAIAVTLPLGGVVVHAQAEAERQLDAAIERLRTALGPDARITIGSRQVDPVTGRARLGDVAITEGARRLSAAELWLSELSADRLGRAEARSLRLDEGKGAVTEATRVLVAGLPLPAPGAGFSSATLAFESIELEGLNGSKPGEGTMRLARLSAQGYVPPGPGRPGMLRAGTLEGFELASTTTETPSARIARVVLAELAFPDPNGADPDPRAFRAGEVTLEGFRMADRKRDTELELPRFSLRDWLPGRTAQLAAEGLSMGANFGQLGPGQLRVARVAASGVDGPTTLAAILDGIQPPDPAPGVAQQAVMEGVAMQAGGAPIFSLGRVAVEGRLDAQRRTTGGMTLDALRVSVPRGSAPPLEQMGFHEIVAGLELRGEGHRDGGPLGISPFRISWEGAGVLTIDGSFDNLPAIAAGAPVDRAKRMADFAAVRIAELTLRYQDQGLLGRTLSQQARAQRVPEARLREQWAQAALSAPVPGAPPAGRGKGAATPAADPYAPMREAIASFIRRPGTLEVTVRPPRPLPIAELQSMGATGPAATVERLGLRVRTP